MNKKIVIKILISFFCIGYLVFTIDISELKDSLVAANFLNLILTVITLFFGGMLCTYKWMLLIRAQGIYMLHFSRLLSLYYIGHFFGNFFPTEIGGDVIKGYEVGKISGKHAESLVAVAMERITGFLMLLMCALLGIFFNWDLANELNITYLLFVLLGITFLTIIVFLNKRFAKWIKRKLNFLRYHKSIAKLQSLYEAFYLYKKNIKILFFTLTISLIFQVYTIWFTYALMKCLNIEASFLQLFLIVPFIAIISMIPLSINGIGIREGAFVFFFTSTGVDASQSLALALVYRFSGILYAMLGGFLYIKYSFQKNKNGIFKFKHGG